MTSSNRRIFLMQVAGSASVLAVATAPAHAEEKLTETDPYAKSMGFKYDSSQVDGKRYPRHEASQNCAKCQLFDGKETDEWGACSFFGGRLVKPTGWCRNFKAKKA